MAHRAVNNGVADLGNDAAENRRIDNDDDLDLLALALGQGSSETLDLVVGQCDGRTNLGDNFLAFGRIEVKKTLNDLGKFTNSTIADNK